MAEAPVIQTFGDIADWADVATNLIVEALTDGGRGKTGWATFAGSGGSTPSPIYERLSRRRNVQDWQHTLVTLVDERYVPEPHPDSNAALLRRTLITREAAGAEFIPLYSSQITVDRAAALATRTLKAELDGQPFDAVLLGMGEDGHICSMFPDNPALKQLLAPNNPPLVLAVPKSRSTSAPQQDRLSMNIPWLASARRVVLALTGAKKREVFEREVAGDPSVSPIAALVAARAGDIEVLWTEAAR